jgi:hypothetical protein
MSNTNRLALPYILQSQSQKEVTHNDGLNLLDALVQAVVQNASLNTPPASPTLGNCYIVGGAPTGAWVSQSKKIAQAIIGGWLFIPPFAGLSAYNTADGNVYRYDGTNWVSTAISSLQNLSMLGINASADATNKLAVASSAILFNHIGNGVQVKLNKNSAGDSASFLFQSNWGGRAEIGNTGDDDFHFKVSPDGGTWYDAIIIDKDSGDVKLNHKLEHNGIKDGYNTPQGSTFKYGIPGMLNYTSASGLAMTAGRLHFSLFYVERPIAVSGCFIANYIASTTAGAVMRAGIYKADFSSDGASTLGIGDRVADFGTQVCDAAGHLDFSIGSPAILDVGWYYTCWGTDGAGASAIYANTMRTDAHRFYKYSSGTSARPRSVNYGYLDSLSSQITAGLSASQSPLSVSAGTGTNWYQCMYLEYSEV